MPSGWCSGRRSGRCKLSHLIGFSENLLILCVWQAQKENHLSSAAELKRCRTYECKVAKAAWASDAAEFIANWKIKSAVDLHLCIVRLANNTGVDFLANSVNEKSLGRVHSRVKIQLIGVRTSGRHKHYGFLIWYCDVFWCSDIRTITIHESISALRVS